MGLGKQAKTLSKGQVEAVLGYLAKTRHPARNRLIFLLSVKAGLRAKEIARLTWWMTNNSWGEIGRAICLQDSASKGRSGRMIPLSDEVRDALIEYRRQVVSFTGPFVVSTERSLSTSPQAIVNMFQRWYRHLGFVGCSSHSGRRNLHHQRRAQDIHGRRFATRRADAGRSLEHPNHAGLYRCQSGSPGEGR